VELEFATSRLESASVDSSLASRTFGVSIGHKYIQRLAILRGTANFAHLYGIRSLRFHPLKGDRAGQYALFLTGNYRLVVERISKDKVRIVSVEDYHGD
jgi:proteic killer suppression protein